VNVIGSGQVRTHPVSTLLHDWCSHDHATIVERGCRPYRRLQLPQSPQRQHHTQNLGCCGTAKVPVHVGAVLQWGGCDYVRPPLVLPLCLADHANPQLCGRLNRCRLSYILQSFCTHTDSPSLCRKRSLRPLGSSCNNSFHHNPSPQFHCLFSGTRTTWKVLLRSPRLSVPCESSPILS
jgi:hypothetical protein